LLAKVTELQSKIAELEEEKGSYLMTQEEIIGLKAEKDKMERDYLERLGEFEKNFTETMSDYDSRLEESEKSLNAKDETLKETENKVQELSSSLEKAKEQLVKMKRQFQAKLKALKEEQKDGTSANAVRLKFNFVRDLYYCLNSLNSISLYSRLPKIRRQRQTKYKHWRIESPNWKKRKETIFGSRRN